MKKKSIKNKILHSVRTPLFRMRIVKDKKREAKKVGYEIRKHKSKTTI